MKLQNIQATKNDLLRMKHRQAHIFDGVKASRVYPNDTPQYKQTKGALQQC
jgi:hypothetical protein